MKVIRFVFTLGMKVLSIIYDNINRIKYDELETRKTLGLFACLLCIVFESIVLLNE